MVAEEEEEVVLVVVMMVVCSNDGPLEAWGCYAMKKNNWLQTDQRKHRPTDRPTDRLTDRPTDRPTDTPTYRDARTHLKSKTTGRKGAVTYLTCEKKSREVPRGMTERNEVLSRNTTMTN